MRKLSDLWLMIVCLYSGANEVCECILSLFREPLGNLFGRMARLFNASMNLDSSVNSKRQHAGCNQALLNTPRNMSCWPVLVLCSQSSVPPSQTFTKTDCSCSSGPLEQNGIGRRHWLRVPFSQIALLYQESVRLIRPLSAYRASTLLDFLTMSKAFLFSKGVCSIEV